MRFYKTAAILALALLPASVAWGQPALKPPPVVRMKDITHAPGGGKWVTGVVEKVDDDGLLLLELDGRGGVVEHPILPVDLLRGGKVLKSATGPSAYRWQDVKRGDTIEVQAKQDDVDKEWYCTRIEIIRRPGEKLPESQDPKNDGNYPWRRLTNDLLNGVDVTDEEILKVCPPRPERKGSDGTIIPAKPGGLNAEWQAKLDAIRAKKKDKDLKVPPPEKK